MRTPWIIMKSLHKCEPISSFAVIRRENKAQHLQETSIIPTPGLMLTLPKTPGQTIQNLLFRHLNTRFLRGDETHWKHYIGFFHSFWLLSNNSNVIEESKRFLPKRSRGSVGSCVIKHVQVSGVLRISAAILSLGLDSSQKTRGILMLTSNICFFVFHGMWCCLRLFH